MLIRSQDNKRLIPITLGYLAVEKYSSKYVVFLNSGYLEYAWWSLGEYSTEAKAIKVLDMIQMANFRVEKMKMIYSHSGHLSNSCIQDFTFQMPQDEEV